jgi:uncharacterized protein YeaO (DUF488 family)
MVHLKRAYERPQASDGHRVLVDRLWPRGLRKDASQLDEWLKDVGPSDALRKWFGHDPRRFGEFERRYARELHEEPAEALVDSLARRAARETVTLVYAARDDEHNNAVVLAHELEKRLRARGRARTRPGSIRAKRAVR